MSSLATPRKLSDLPPPNEATARRLIALLGIWRPEGVAPNEMNSEPLEVRLDD